MRSRALQRLPFCCSSAAVSGDEPGIHADVKACCALSTLCLVALSVVGMMVMVSAGDLMTLYMGLELQSLALYVVASLRRDSARSTEAGLKYFVLGALSSGLLLYGASLTYGFAGTTLFSGIIQTATEGISQLALLFGLVFIISGLAFKVSAVPFHMWTPDVYEGSHRRRSRRSLRQRRKSRLWAFLRVFCMTLRWRCQRLEPSDRFAVASCPCSLVPSRPLARPTSNV